MSICKDCPEKVDPIIVLHFAGKHEEINNLKVHTFRDQEYAEAFCKRNSTGSAKHWEKAFIADTTNTQNHYEFSNMCPN